jgi:tetratricopeptide (TPR) repeat protein
MMDAARETLIQARQLGDALIDLLNRAEVLQSIGLAEAESGMMAEAAETFQESLKLAESIDTVAGPTPCPLTSSVEGRLDTLLQRLAQQMAKAGNISGSLRAVRSIVYEPSVRAETLRAIAEIQAQSGQTDAAGQVLKEVLVWFQVPPPERWPSCPDVRHLPPSGDLDAWRLSSIAKTQAKAGLTDEAAAMFGKTLQLIPKIKDPAYLKAAGDSVAIGFLKADVSKVSALSAVARAQHEVGFEAQSAATFEQAMQAAMTLGEPFTAP